MISSGLNLPQQYVHSTIFTASTTNVKTKWITPSDQMSIKPHWKYTASNSDQKLMVREPYKQGQAYMVFSFTVLPRLQMLVAEKFGDLEWFLEGGSYFHRYLPRAFILALNCSSFVQPMKTFSARDEILFLLMFKIFSSFKHMGEHRHEILFLWQPG